MSRVQWLEVERVGANLAAVAPNISKGVPLEATRGGVERCVDSNREGASIDDGSEDSETRAGCSCSVLALVVVLGLIIGLSVGLTNRNNEVAPPPTTATAHPNTKIYDEALELLETTPLQMKQVPSGELLSFREYNPGQPHTLVVLPGFMADDSMTAILAALPQFRDHHIIAVNPRGWHGSTMNSEITSHEELADEVMELLSEMNIQKAMAMGLSTGGGIALQMALKYPNTIAAAFLVHSIPLSGLKYLTIGNELVILKSVEEVRGSTILPTYDPDSLYDLFKSMSANPGRYIPKDHGLNEYFAKAALNMPGSKDVSVANASFNVTPIKTPFAAPSEALSTLKSKVVVIHGSQDTIVPWQIVESLTKLAIAEQWAPPGTLSLYDDGLGHMSPIDSPSLLADVYRKALEEQILGSNPV